MLLSQLAQASQRVAETRKRNEKLAALAATFAAASDAELRIAVPWLAGVIPAPTDEGAGGKLGVGPKLLIAQREVPPATRSSLSLLEVERRLNALRALQGKGSSNIRATMLGELFALGTAPEQRFLSGLLSGELRQGALESLVVDALARSASLDVALVRRAQMLLGDLPELARLTRAGEAALRAVQVQLFRPVLPMLASPAEDAAAALGHLGAAWLEWKLDGARVQVHKRGEEVRVYSRLLNEVTAAVPEVVEAVRGLPVSELILDGEAIALRKDRTPLPFQVTMKRFGRKTVDPRLCETLPLSSFYFDCLYADGSLLEAPTRDRLAALDELLPRSARVPSIQTDDPQRAAGFLRSALEAGHEGVMAKSLEATYEAGRRGQSWLKLKQAHTLDLLVLAAEWGSGRRKGWLSNLHLGAIDVSSGQPVMLGKTFKGLTDQLLKWQTEALLSREIARDTHTVYVRPELVVEIAFSDVQASPQYPAGLALRFARVKRYREDKSPDEADTLDRVRALAPDI